MRYALINVCSLMTISVVSAFGRLTLDAMAVESVSTMTLWSINQQSVQANDTEIQDFIPIQPHVEK